MWLNFNLRFELCAIQSNSNRNHSILLRKPFTSDSIQQISMLLRQVFMKFAFTSNFLMHLLLVVFNLFVGTQVIFDENVDQCQIAQLLNKAGRVLENCSVTWSVWLGEPELTCHVHVAPETNMFGPDRSVAFFNHSTYLKASFSAYFNPLIFGWFSPQFLSCPPH